MILLQDGKLTVIVCDRCGRQFVADSKVNVVWERHNQEVGQTVFGTKEWCATCCDL